MSTEQVEEHFYPLLTRLKNATWYSSQISLSALISTIYPHISPDKKEELRKYEKLFFRNYKSNFIVH